ncbi:acyltransferase family protein [Catenulispora pinisilvae]|uniref:acyltransferase family protein n=1 Tax=Catenulispora pinisilvae TaxID=2705253 RepID=UPI001892535E|nr:acyltransferase family protein [Catenulispora pinisilvae]
MRGFRADIEGLRAVAVVAVLGFHAAVPGMAGGYVGVDVFFVMSGFLITGQVVRRSDFSLAEFYARRARRILPAASVVLLFTALATWAWLPPLRQQDVAYDLLTAALNGGNWRFVADQTNYLAAARAPSPLLHYWSLGVEEQFYVVWAPLVLLAILVARKRNSSVRRFVLAEILLLSAVSFALSLHWTHTSAPLAYMGSPSRAWEFGAGAILAVALDGRSVGLKRNGLNRNGLNRVRTAAGFAGAALIIAATVTYDSKTPYPGTAALLPVIGTVLVLFAGAGEYPKFSISGLLTKKTPRAIGRLSFALYLWHWPILVLVQARWGDLPWELAATLAVASAIPAYATMRLVEQPLRFSKLITEVPRRGMAIGAIAVILPLAAGLAVGTGAARTLGDAQPFDIRTLPAAAATGPHLLAAPAANRTGGPTMPTPAQARKDFPPDGDCEVAPAVAISEPCLFLPAQGEQSTAAQASPPTGLIRDPNPPALTSLPTNRIILIGDSHAGQWFSAISRIAADRHLAVEERVKQGCPFADLKVTSPVLGRDYRECYTWRASVLDQLREESRPALIVVSELDWYAPPAQTKAAWGSPLQALTGLGVPIAAIHDTPKPDTDIPVCVSGSQHDWNACAFTKSSALAADPLTEDPRVTPIDFSSLLCPGDECPAVLDGVLLYRDDSHLTDAAAYLLTSRLAAQLPFTSPWHTVFAADFQGPAGAPPPSRDWLIDIGHCYPGCPAPDWGTGEVETMTADPANVHLDGHGALQLTPLRGPDGAWTSGRIETRRSDFAAPPGGELRMSAELTLPGVTPADGAGYWPAFWALGSGVRDGSDPWPGGGEIDVLEALNGHPSLWSTLHCGTLPTSAGLGKVPANPCHEPTGLTSAEHSCPSCTSGQHEYSVEIDRSRTPEQIRWSVDGAEVFHLDATQVDAATWDAAVHHGFFAILDLAVGGTFPGQVGGPAAAHPGPATVPGRPLTVTALQVWTRDG